MSGNGFSGTLLARESLTFVELLQSITRYEGKRAILSRFGKKAHLQVALSMNMTRSFRKHFGLLSLLFLVGLVSGCKEEGFVDVRNKVPVVPVTGKILVDGKPLVYPQQGRIILHPDAPTQEKLPKDIPKPSSWSAPDGSTFEIGTYDGSDGVPAGTYKLTVEVGKRSLMNGSFRGGDLKEKYKDPETSEISVTITGDEGSIDLGTIELTSE